MEEDNSSSGDEGFEQGFDDAIRVLKGSRKFLDTGHDAEDVLEDKLKEIKENGKKFM